MADGIEVDLSEVRNLSADIVAAAGRLPREARAVVAKGALNIKKDTRDNVSDDPTWKHLASTVNYSMSGNAYFSEAEVGYDDVGQGELAGIYEFGSARRAPHPTLYPAASREAPRFEQAMADAAARVIEETL